MTFRLRSLSAAAIALLALTGVAATASAKPAREVGYAASDPAYPNVTGGHLTVTPITEEEFSESLEYNSGQCVTDSGFTLCQMADFDDSYGNQVVWTAVASVGDASDGVYASAEVMFAKEGDVYSGQGDVASPAKYVQLEWDRPRHPGDPTVGIPGEASGLTFEMVLAMPGGHGGITGYCTSDPELHYEYQLHCVPHPPNNVN